MITPEQKEFKKGKIGASQCAAALGVSPFQTRAALFHELKGNVTPPDIGAKGRIGNAIEPVIIQEYEIEHGIKVIPANDTLIHPDHDWMICHLDGRMPDYEMILELKNVGPTMFHHWGLDGDPDGVPMYVNFQCIHQALLADVERVDVAAFFGGNALRVHPLEITKKAKQGVLDGLVAYWDDFIIPNKQPEVTENDIDLLKQLYWNCCNEKIIQVESTATAIGFQDYRNVKDQIKVLQKKADAYKASIIEIMGDAGVLMRGEDAEFTHKKTKDREKVDWEGVCSDMRDHLSDIGEEGDVEYLDGLVKGNTTTKKGHRMFLDKFK